VIRLRAAARGITLYVTAADTTLKAARATRALLTQGLRPPDKRSGFLEAVSQPGSPVDPLRGGYWRLR
jgi:hypothetical protein